MKRHAVEVFGWMMCSAIVVGGLCFVLAFALGGCRDTLPTEASKSLPEANPKILTTYNIPSGALTTLVAARCAECHQGTPNSPNGVVITSGSPWTISGVTAQTLHDHVCDGRAPVNRILTNGEYTNYFNWTVGVLGADPNTCTVPSTLHWEMEDHISGLSLPTDGEATGLFHARTVEDNSDVELEILNYTESYRNWTKKCVRFADYDSVPLSIHSSSDDPVNYVFIRNFPYGTRIKAFVAEGYVRIDNRVFFGFHMQEMKQGPTASSRRDKRTYMRFQMEDYKLGFRSKTEDVEDDLETIGAWQNDDDNILVESTLYEEPVLDVDGVGDFIYERFYFCRVTVTNASGYTHMKGEVWDKDPSLGGATLKGIASAQRGNVTFGGVTWGTYERNSTNPSPKSNWLSEWVIDATSMEGAGTSGGACGSCELDR